MILNVMTLPPVSACSVICSSWECGSAAWSSLALWVWTTHPCGWSFSCRTCAAQTEALYGTLLRSVHGPELLVSCFSAMGSWIVNALGWACGSVCSCTHFKTTWGKLVYNSTPCICFCVYVSTVYVFVYSLKVKNFKGSWLFMGGGQF